MTNLISLEEIKKATFKQEEELTNILLEAKKILINNNYEKIEALL